MSLVILLYVGLTDTEHTFSWRQLLARWDSVPGELMLLPSRWCRRPRPR